MNSERYQRVASIFQRACTLVEPSRTEYLDAECAGDAELRREVEKMLATDVEDDFLASPYTDHVEDDAPIVRVGEYKVSGEIGRGGMGVVLRAEQVSPRRDVAIKLISPELSTRGASGRLSREAELLGRLRHPGIAQIYEAGQARVTLEGGRTHDQPYIAMELVDGTSLTEHVRMHKLDRRARLELLADIADAVQHAHQRGVVHLDLKPANIIVDDSGHARVLDFGVARAIDADEDALAQGRAIAGTLAYMAPEQLTGRDAEIDTRADVFALGALAFELLTGTLPRDIDDQDPADAIHAMLVTPARRPSEVDPTIKGELEAVILKAIEPSSDRRYASAAQFAADIRRYLRHMPVEARRQNLGRSATLFMQRNRALVIASAIAAVAMVGGVVALSLGLVRAHRSAEQAKLAQLEADAKAANASRMADFLQSAIFGVDPEELGPQASFFDALDYAANRAHRDLADHPEVEGDVRFSLAFVYRRHAMFEKAMDHLRVASRLRREVHGPDDPKTLEALEEVAYLTYLVDGTGDEAEQMFRRILSVQAAAGRSNSEGAGWQQLKLGLALMAQDRLAEAREPLERSARILEQHYGRPMSARPLGWQAVVALDSGDATSAEALIREALARIEGVDEQEYAEARLQLTLMRVLIAQGRYDQAKQQFQPVLDSLTRLLPADHVEIADAHELAAEIALHEGRHAEASHHAHECLRMRRSKLSAHHPALVWAWAMVTLTDLAPRDPDRAMEELEAQFQELDQSIGADHRVSLRVLEARISCAEQAGNAIAAAQMRALHDQLSNRRALRLHAGEDG